MKISSSIKSQKDVHQARVQTNEAQKEVAIPPKSTGYGSSVNGGELLVLSIATCFCNDLYREAAKRNINISSAEITASAEFGAEGEPGFNFSYSANVIANASQEEIEDLIQHTDSVAEIHNTLRKGISINLQLK